MGKRVNPMGIKAALTYDAQEAARALGVTKTTIRNWIKDGLPVMSERKPHLMSGQAIREYLRTRYKAAKRPLEADQLFCPACRTGKQPLAMTVTVAPMSSKTELLRGICSHCEGVCTRMIGSADRTQFAKTFNIAKQATNEA